MTDLNRREIAVFAPLVVLTIWMGIYPSSFLDFMHVSVDNLLIQVETALRASSSFAMVGR